MIPPRPPSVTLPPSGVTHGRPHAPCQPPAPRRRVAEFRHLRRCLRRSSRRLMITAAVTGQIDVPGGGGVRKSTAESAESAEQTEGERGGPVSTRSLPPPAPPPLPPPPSLRPLRPLRLILVPVPNSHQRERASAQRHRAASQERPLHGSQGGRRAPRMPWNGVKWSWCQSSTRRPYRSTQAAHRQPAPSGSGGSLNGSPSPRPPPTDHPAQSHHPPSPPRSARRRAPPPYRRWSPTRPPAR